MTPAEPLDALRDAGVIADIDCYFAQLMADLNGSAAIALPAALLSATHRVGHTCLRLDRCAGRRFVDCLDWLAPTAGDAVAQLPTEIRECRLPSLAELADLLATSEVVANPTSEPPAEQLAHKPFDAIAERPLVNDRGRLYFQRLFAAEQRLAKRLRELAEPAAAVQGMEAALRRLFPDADQGEARSAARAAVERRLCIVTGGPGTGKTTLAARLIALFVQLGLAKRRRIALAAPTGKAAARLQQAVASQLVALEAAGALPGGETFGATTLHRLLRQRDRLALLDVLIVDECSMVDLEMMARLADALPPDARLVLLGDAAQLGSVQPGAVFRDLCATAEQDSPLAHTVVGLTKSHRFQAEGGIGRLAAAILEGDAQGAIAALREQQDLASELQPMSDAAAFDRFACRHAEEWCAPLIAAQRDGDAQAPAFPRRRVVCAHRSGPFGTNRLNRVVEGRLRELGLIPSGEEFYIGRPIIVVRNDPQTGLANGDTGVVVEDRASGTRQVWFPELTASAGERKVVSPLRLPTHESFFALTVHRAQGSEYREVAFVPGAAESRLNTRELFYTAITRARDKVVMYAELASIRAGVGRRAERGSALLERLSA